jgi:hypothetical protein
MIILQRAYDADGENNNQIQMAFPSTFPHELEGKDLVVIVRERRVAIARRNVPAVVKLKKLTIIEHYFKLFRFFISISEQYMIGFLLHVQLQPVVHPHYFFVAFLAHKHVLESARVVMGRPPVQGKPKRVQQVHELVRVGRCKLLLHLRNIYCTLGMWQREGTSRR